MHRVVDHRGDGLAARGVDDLDQPQLGVHRAALDHAVARDAGVAGGVDADGCGGQRGVGLLQRYDDFGQHRLIGRRVEAVRGDQLEQLVRADRAGTRVGVRPRDHQVLLRDAELDRLLADVVVELAGHADGVDLDDGRLGHAVVQHHGAGHDRVVLACGGLEEAGDAVFGVRIVAGAQGRGEVGRDVGEGEIAPRGAAEARQWGGGFEVGGDLDGRGAGLEQLGSHGVGRGGVGRDSIGYGTVGRDRCVGC